MSGRTTQVIEESRIWTPPNAMDERARLGSEWDEAKVIADPVSKPDAPRVLVKRKDTKLFDKYGNELSVLSGMGVISLFTGAGGMDLGLEKSQFVTLVQHEWAQAPCETLIHNRPRCFRHAALIQGDLRKTPTEMLLDESGLRVGHAHIVCGGPPCQGFTTANTNAVRGKFDARNDLVYEFLRVVREAMPRYFIMENVSGFVTFNKGEYFNAYLHAAFDCFYELVYGLIDCSEYGVPQHRERFICMGTRRDVAKCDGLLAGLPAPTHFNECDLEKIAAIDGLNLWEHELRLLMQAPGIRYYPARPVLIPPGPINRQSGRARSFIEFYRKLYNEEPDRIVSLDRRREAA